jgi:hypothetical protein
MIHINIKNPAPKDNLSILPKWGIGLKTEKRNGSGLESGVFSDGGAKKISENGDFSGHFRVYSVGLSGKDCWRQNPPPNVDTYHTTGPWLDTRMAAFPDYR